MGSTERECYNLRLANHAMTEQAKALQSACAHERTQVIAQDRDAKYVECLDCGAILEAEERKGEPEGSGESLADA